MQINQVNVSNYKQPAFGHNNPWSDSSYNTKEKAIIAGTTAIGTLSGLAVLAKYHGYSLSPKKMFTNLKNSFWNKCEFDDIPVITMGAGSCLGGLAGGFIIDRDKENRKAKLREALLQMTNISLPIVSTVYIARLGKHLGNKYWDKCRPKNEYTFRTKVPQAILGMTGLFGGVFTANLVANKINEKIFKQGKGRPVHASDFSAHLDDFCVAAKQISDNSLTHWVSRLVPIALMIAGNEVGNTNKDNVDS